MVMFGLKLSIHTLQTKRSQSDFQESFVISTKKKKKRVIRDHVIKLRLPVVVIINIKILYGFKKITRDM